MLLHYLHVKSWAMEIGLNYPLFAIPNNLQCSQRHTYFAEKATLGSSVPQVNVIIIYARD